MNEITDRFARILHHRAATLERGDPVALPIVTSTSFHITGEPDTEFTYARAGTPTVAALEAELGVLEEARTVCLGSGMAAVAAALFATVKAGDRVLIPSDGYYNTRKLAHDFLAPLGVDIVEMATPDMSGADLEGVDVVMVETPSNPFLQLCDLAEVAAAAKRAGAVLIADNTTASPLGQSPLDLGFDLSVVADTKHIAGHSDVLAGHVCGRDDDLMERVQAWRTLAGAVLGPLDAFLVHRGLATLELRWERMCANALALASRLEAELGQGRVRYPGLASHPQHGLAETQMREFGSVLGVDLGTSAAADTFIAKCPVLIPATSFGGVHSSAERRARWGDAVPEGYVRISCGVEPTDGLINAAARTLRAVGA